MQRVFGVALAAALVLFSNAAIADQFTAKQIAAELSDSKTTLEQEAWWKENMAGQVRDLTGKVTDVEKGTFSGYWVTLDIGRNIMVRCGMSSKWDGIVQKIRKGQQYTCRGYVSDTWTSMFGIGFSADAG